MRVRYRYDLQSDALRSEVTVTELCGRGRCGRTRKLAFLKEPKLVLHAGPAYDLRPCHGGDPNGPMMRRWELAGRRGRSIGALLAAWEGGRGGYDCEPLARVFGPREGTWRAVLSYSLMR